MEKLVRFFAVIIVCMPMVLYGQDDKKYLAGAVPEIDGKVVFSKAYYLPRESMEDIYDHLHAWLDLRMKSNKNESRIVLSERETGSIAAVGYEYLVFTSNPFNLDRSLMNYLIIIDCMADTFAIHIEKIRYEYENEKLTAENMISDKVALKKKQTSMYRRNKKFRVKTIEFANDMFEAAKKSLEVKQ